MDVHRNKEYVVAIIVKIMDYKSRRTVYSKWNLIFETKNETINENKKFNWLHMCMQNWPMFNVVYFYDQNKCLVSKFKWNSGLFIYFWSLKIWKFDIVKKQTHKIEINRWKMGRERDERMFFFHLVSSNRIEILNTLKDFHIGKREIENTI